MKETKQLALAMRAGAYALRKSIEREGGSIYVFDPFNECGMKASMEYCEAAEILSNESDVIVSSLVLLDGEDCGELVTETQLVSLSEDGRPPYMRHGYCPHCKKPIATNEDLNTEDTVEYCYKCGQKVRWE
ncbi:MAG: hypothetical protein IJK26_09975 [Clostridia bacterium]|nr:hypothetical protein [Clostridia bacterium]